MDCPALMIIFNRRNLPCKWDDCKGVIQLFRSVPSCTCCHDIRWDLIPKKEKK